jgi:DNA-binding MarR family transcriptional regulator
MAIASSRPRVVRRAVSPGQDEMRRQAVAWLVHQVGRLLHSRSFSAGLNPAQWNALRYLSSANESACTVTAFARHHMTSKGTASETFRSLAGKGLVAQGSDGGDSRLKIFRPTASGLAVLKSDPLRQMGETLRVAASDDLDATARVMEVILRAMLEGTEEVDLD